jgi:hypothetical protein
MYLPRFALTRRRAVLAALAVGLMAAAWPLYSQWREREFRASLTSQGHYVRAMRLLYPRTGHEPFTNDMETAMHHLRVIPVDSPMHREATDLLLLLELRMDRPQDFAAIEQARFISCMAEGKAWAVEILEQTARERPCRHFLTRDGKCVFIGCSTMWSHWCAPLANPWRLFQLEALVRDRP